MSSPADEPDDRASAPTRSTSASASGDTTALIKPRQLTSADYLSRPVPDRRDPARELPVLPRLAGQRVLDHPLRRRHVGVRRRRQLRDTFEALVLRSARFGRGLGDELPVLAARAAVVDAEAEAIARRVVGDLPQRGRLISPPSSRPASRSSCWGGRSTFPLAMPAFLERYWRMQRGWLWDPRRSRPATTRWTNSRCTSGRW